MISSYFFPDGDGSKGDVRVACWGSWKPGGLPAARKAQLRRHRFWQSKNVASGGDGSALIAKDLDGKEERVENANPTTL